MVKLPTSDFSDQLRSTIEKVDYLGCLLDNVHASLLKKNLKLGLLPSSAAVLPDFSFPIAADISFAAEHVLVHELAEGTFDRIHSHIASRASDFSRHLVCGLCSHFNNIIESELEESL